MRIVTIVGARPQFIKAAVLSRLIRQRTDLEELLIHTGQHYDENMSDVFFHELDIPRPAVHLGVGSGRHGAQTGKMLAAIEEVLLDKKPDVVLVYGDTNSTLAGAFAASKLHIPIAHVEAGLRSFNRRMPEEVNRVVTDHLSTWLFVPSAAGLANLRHEGIAEDKVRLVGDVMYDAAEYYGQRAPAGLLDKLGLRPGHYALATIHRAENTDDPGRLHAIFSALQAVAEHCPVALPLHPRTRAILQKAGALESRTHNLRLLDPVGYLDMVALEKQARLIATDSGGVQKEAFFHKVPCVTLRDETEWVELVQAGWNRLAPPAQPEDMRRIMLEAIQAPPPDDYPAELYGGAQAGPKILAGLAA